MSHLEPDPLALNCRHCRCPPVLRTQCVQCSQLRVERLCGVMLLEVFKGCEITCDARELSWDCGDHGRLVFHCTATLHSLRRGYGVGVNHFLFPPWRRAGLGRATARCRAILGIIIRHHRNTPKCMQTGESAAQERLECPSHRYGCQYYAVRS